MPQKDENKNKLVPLIVETNDIDVTYNEAVLKGDKSIGYITSGGFAHFVNKATYLAVKLFPPLSLVKNKNKEPTIGNNIKDDRIGKFII